MGCNKMHALHIRCSNLSTLFVTIAKNAYGHDKKQYTKQPRSFAVMRITNDVGHHCHV